MSSTLTILPIPRSLMPELTDSDSELPTNEQETPQVQTTVVPSVLAEMHTSVEIEESDVEVQEIEEAAAWVQWFLANLPQLGQQLSGTHRSNAMNFINDSCSKEFKK